VSVKKGPSGRYQARIFSHGKQVAMATFKKQDDAEGWEATQKAALYMGGWTNPRNADVLFGEVIDRFNSERLGTKSKHTYDTDENNLRNHVPAKMKMKPIGSITSSNLNTLYSAMMKTHARSTVLRFRDTLVACCKWAVGNGILVKNIAEASEVPKGTGEDIPPVRPLSVEQLASLIASAREVSPAYADLIELISLSGLRWGEAVELRVSDVDTFARPELVVSRSKSDGYNIKTTKSGRSRPVPLTSRAWTIVESQMAGKEPDALLFPGARGGHLNAGYFRRKLDWSTISFGHRIHDLRHSAAAGWLRAGVSAKAVSLWLGHSNPAITHRVYSGYIRADSDTYNLSLLERAEAREELE